MGWGEDFRAALLAPHLRPRHIVKQAPPALGGFHGVGDFWQISSHDEGPYYARCIARHGHSYSAGTLRPGEWQTTISEARIALTGASGSMPDARGQLVQWCIGFPGMSVDDYAPILTGQVQGYHRDQSGTWFVTIRSVLTSLVCRPTAEPTELALFHEMDNLSHETEIDIPYDGSAATISVLDSSTALRETGGDYLLEVQGDSGDPYLVEASGSTSGPDTFTGVSSAILGTSASAAAAGNSVRPLAYIEDHPVDVVRKILLSTGSGDNHPTYDTLPASWSVGLPDAAVDHEECNLTISNDDTTAANKWFVYSQSFQTDGFGWLQSVLAPAGYFMTDHQGQIAVRMGRDPATSGELIPLANVITTRDIVTIDNYGAWDPDQPVEYARIKLRDTVSVTDTDGPMVTLPGSFKTVTELPFIFTAASDWRAAIAARIAGWALRVGEALDLTLVGWRFAHLSPGDAVIVECPLPTRVAAATPWLVTASEPDWFGATCRVRLVRIPESEE
jgi:hypothetical protein